MLIGLLQMEPVAAAPARNLARIEIAARSAVAAGAELLVTPEMSLSGYAIGADIARLAEPRDGAMVSALGRMAVEQGLALLAGFPERDGLRVFNSVMLAKPDGTRIFYRKCHLYGPEEKAHFSAGGEPPPLFEIGGFKAGLLICYDIEFPEMVRGLALAGAELILVATALAATPCCRRVAETIVPARALENHVFIAYADLCGTERGLTYQGDSSIVGPDGEILARAGRGEALLLARLDRNAYAEVIAEVPYLADRRPELYCRLGQA
jgi:predicted amidohydrolase